MNRNAAPIHFDQYGTNCLFYIDDEKTFQLFMIASQHYFLGQDIMGKHHMDTLYLLTVCSIQYAAYCIELMASNFVWEIQVKNVS